MKKLSKEEFDRLALKGHGNSSPFFRAIIALRPGEGLFISRKEWNASKAPTRICRYIEKKHKGVKYTCGRLADGSGWAVKRES